MVHWNESVTQTGPGSTSVITQSYLATIAVAATGDGSGGWTLAGSADITGSYTSDYTGQLTDILGAPCTVHYTDSATGQGSVGIVDGGITALDGFYEFTMYVPGLDGSNQTVRDDSDCDGPNNHETVVWTIAPTTAGGSGAYTDLDQITGSSSQPRPNGTDTITWNFSLGE